MTADWSAVPWGAVATATVGVFTLAITVVLWRLERRRARQQELKEPSQSVPMAPVTVERVEGRSRRTAVGCR